MPTIPLLICDDSNMARKQLLRALPPEWDVSVSMATNGLEGLDAVRRGLGEVMLLDLSTILIGACLSGIAEQIDIEFSQGHPQVLGSQSGIDDLIRINQTRWQKTLAVEISYSLEGHSINFDLLMLFTEDSVERLTKKLAYLMS